ncbi:LytTR family transcriptional regulator DNA-binding domain-containing protein [Chryseobacterium taihuense]|nr:LytTR family transcriptional regulator DNA-binding domain-containing protein [Chryseobacterium taihuense]
MHKSFIINLNQVKSLRVRKVTLTSEHEIPISESYRINFFNKIK